MVRMGSGCHSVEGRAVSEWLDAREWYPPKSGKKFLAVVDQEIRFVAFGKTSHVPIQGFCLTDQGVEEFDLCEFTHWMPLPDLPESPK
jgi:hypothetical protein